MLDTSVKYSESTQLGAPVLSSSPETREKMRAGMIGLSDLEKLSQAAMKRRAHKYIQPNVKEN